MKKLIGLFLLGSLTFFQSCTSKQHPISFYHWRTGFAIHSKEKQFLEETAPNTKVYIRAIDLLWSNRLNAENQVSYMKIKPDSLQYIKEVALVVFLNNEVLEKAQKRDIIYIAARLGVLLNKSRAQFDSNTKIILNEVQIDCDWTPETKEKYFRFLDYVRTESERFGFNKLSATVRLNQVLQPMEYGFPPVDDAVLMFYNMQNTKTYVGETKESEPLKEALNNYGLHLDVAIPLSSWGIHKRDGQSVNLIYDLDEAAVEASNCCQKIGEDTFEVINNTYANREYVVVGDQIELHIANKKMAKNTAAFLAQHMPTDDYRIIYYHLENKTLEDYTWKELQEIAKIK